MIDYEDITLQWFASAEEEGRTEEPSEYKLRKAREEGRIAKSSELNSALVMLVGSIVLVVLASWMLSKCLAVMQFFFTNCAVANISWGNVAATFFIFFLQMMCPVAVCALLAGVVANIVQNRGFMFSLKPITPDFSKILPRPGQYLKKTMFSFEGSFNVLKSILKVFVVCLMAYLIITSSMSKILGFLNAVDIAAACKEEGKIVAKLLLFSSVFFLALSIPDYFVQRKQFMETMKMTRQEVKQEYKEMEGDPDVKGYLQQQQRQLLQHNMPKAVAEADVVITNPTHFAVALHYESDINDAPEVTAKGADNLAFRIKQIAKENDVPIVENRPLARGLYTDVELGQTIPSSYIRAIATIYAQIDYMENQKKSQRQKR